MPGFGPIGASAIASLPGAITLPPAPPRKHVRQQVREGVGLALQGLATTAGRVHESRIDNLAAGDLPALSIYTTSEEATLVTASAPMIYERHIALNVDGVAAQNADLEDTLDTMAKEVAIALAGGVLALSSKTCVLLYQGVQIDLEGDAQTNTGRISIRYEARIFTEADAPDVVL